jgi:alpha-beta hydrolase superfamily lysophospholipase
VYEFLPETLGNASGTSSNILVCIHGAYCDGQLFAYLANRVSRNGYRVYALDLLGHGKSEGDRGDTQFDDSIETINEVIREIKNKIEDQNIGIVDRNSTYVNQNLKSSKENNTSKIKIFILGHSLGCTFVLWYVRRFKSTVDGIILMAPYLRIPTLKKRSDVEPSSLSFIYLFLRRQITPKKVMAFIDVIPKLKELGGEEISLLVKHREESFRYTLRFIVDIVGLRNNRVKEIMRIDLPVLILHGKRDRLVYSEVSQILFNLIDSKKKEIRLFDCNHWFYHSIFYQELVQLLSKQPCESDRNKIAQTIIDWTNQLAL